MRFLLAVGGLFMLGPCLPATAQSAGVMPEWEARKQLATLAEHVQRLQPVLDQVHAEEWVSKGAPQAYADQAKRVRAEIGYLIQTTQLLSKEPDKLTAALDALFRMQALDALLRSVSAGIQRYQNPAVAELLLGLVADTASDRDKLRQYVLDLAAAREAEFKVMDEEAQRCRSSLTGRPRVSARAKEHK